MTEAPATGPMAGLTVLDLTHAAAGPVSSMIFGDFGATVIKVEKPGRGDGSRHMRMTGKFADPLIGSDYYLGLNRNKLSVGIDMSDQAGVDLVRDLALKADILVQNFRPGMLEDLGICYEQLRESNPGLIWCDISAFPPDGPLKDAPGMDIVVQARAGTIAATGVPGGEPMKPAPSLADLSGGLQATIGILMALYERQRTGLGQKVQVSLYHATLFMLSNYASVVLNTDEEIQPMGSGHPQLAPYQAYATADGWMFIAVGTNGLWRRLCRMLGREAWIEDPRFVSNWARVQHKPELAELLNAEFCKAPTETWMERLAAAGVPASPVVSVREAHHRELAAGSLAVTTVDHPDYGPTHLPGLPIELAATPARVTLPPPRLGNDTHSVLANVLGLTDSQISTLEASGVVQQYRSRTAAESAATAK